MRKWLLPLLAGALHAAVIRGTVVENLTGHAISRASVMLEPVPGSPGTRQTVRTDRFGFFEFSAAPAGVYLLQATRTPFLAAQYGQKRWNSAGMPLTVQESETPFVTLKMMRYGAISGTVVDENDVGQAEFEVAAFRNTKPPQLVAHATADERGVYRIFGLLPDTYLVRTLGKHVDETGYRPTFAKETEALEQARTVDVKIEQEAGNLNVRPLPGQLFHLSVLADPEDPGPPIGSPVTMTFVSEMGRQIVMDEARTFGGLVRGDYEVFAEAPTEIPGLKQSAYQRIPVREDSKVTLPLRKIPAVSFQIDGMPPRAIEDGSLRVLIRRKDLAGWHSQEVLKIVNGRANLTAGPWELAVVPPDGFYVSGFSGPGSYRRNQRPDGWNEITVVYGGVVRFTLASSLGSVHGNVADAGNPVIGAPVFLEPIDIEPARRLTGIYVAISDVHGRYRFSGLAPGRYRVLSTFEYQSPDSDTMVKAGANELQIGLQTDAAQDLDLYVIR